MTSRKWFFLFCLILLAGCATARPKKSELLLKEICEKNGITWYLDGVSQIVTLRRGDRKASALVGSNLVMLGGEQIRLDGPIERQRQAIIIPPDFEDKVISRLFETVTVTKGRPFRVVVDAGHGGRDPGAISRSGIKEKNIVLDVAQRLKKELRNQGIEVVMTRDSDEFVSLEHRTEIATQANADFFISIHANSNPSRNIDGIELYYCKELGYQEKNDIQLRRNYELFFRKLSMQNDKDIKIIVADMLATYKRAESPMLATNLASQLVRDLHVVNRGLKRAGYHVIRNTLMPAVLIEVGFLSNNREERSLNSPSYRQEIAESISDTILRNAIR
jgi:N-acetylmuramoyl-L-alanine amidase